MFLRRLLSATYARKGEERDAEFIHLVELGKWKQALKLLEQGVDVNAKTAVGATALHLAAANGDIGLVGVLLRHGADPNGGSMLGTPLHVAATAGHMKVVQALLLYDADPTTPDQDGRTPDEHTADDDIQLVLRYEMRKRREAAARSS